MTEIAVEATEVPAQLPNVRVAVLGKNVIRAVTHLDVSKKDCVRAAEVIRELRK